MDTSIIAYGSLLNPSEQAKRYFRNAIPVKVCGYRRIFNQEPSWRKNQGKEIAVLNIEISTHDWFNAIVLPQIPRFHLNSLKTRERGYHLISVPSSSIQAYTKPLINHWKYSTFIGKAEKLNSHLDPNLEYLEVCLKGAWLWGRVFFEDFLSTTYLGNGSLIKDNVKYEGIFRNIAQMDIPDHLPLASLWINDK